MVFIPVTYMRNSITKGKHHNLWLKQQKQSEPIKNISTFNTSSTASTFWVKTLQFQFIRNWGNSGPILLLYGFLTQSFSTVPCSKFGIKAKWLDTNIKITFQTHAQIQEREERKPATLTPFDIPLWSETLAWIGRLGSTQVAFVFYERRSISAFISVIEEDPWFHTCSVDSLATQLQSPSL